MLDWIKNLFGTKVGSEVFEWRTDKSIYKFLVDNLNEEGKLKDAAIDLPDEKPANDKEVRWAPGLFDSILGAQDSNESKLRIDQLVQLLKRISEYGDKRSEADFYKAITETDSIIGIIDDFLKKAVSLSLPINPHLFGFSKALALNTAHRNSVKVGVALIGVCDGRSVVNELKIIGLHDEFTLFSIVALSYISDDLVNDIWEIAQKVDGWGKIHAVDRLVKLDLPEVVKHWLIIDGYKNNIMYEELAYKCAVGGDLHNVVRQESIDKSIFNATTEIVEALITGGPAEDISHYQFSAILIENLIRHSKTQELDLLHFNALNQVKNFLEDLQSDSEEYSKNGWTQDIISDCLIDINEVINANDWSGLVTIALNSSDNVLYWKGKQAAKILQMDYWEIVWRKLRHNPTDSWLWYDAINQAKSENVDAIIEFAYEIIPLNEIATGPKDSLGLGREFNQHQCLDHVITFLGDYPKKGESIILTALDSPVTRNRNMAINTLRKWEKSNWSESITTKLEHLNSTEPNSDTKGNIFRLLND